MWLHRAKQMPPTAKHKWCTWPMTMGPAPMIMIFFKSRRFFTKSMATCQGSVSPAVAVAAARTSATMGKRGAGHTAGTRAALTTLLNSAAWCRCGGAWVRLQPGCTRVLGQRRAMLLDAVRNRAHSFRADSWTSPARSALSFGANARRRAVH